MAVDENRDVLYRFYEEVWNRGMPDVVDDLFAPTYVRNERGASQTLPAETQKQVATAVREGFLELSMRVELMVAEGDLVAAMWRIAGTDRKTGVRVEDYTGVNIFRFEKSRIVEIWNVPDDLFWLQQRGIVAPTQELLGRS